MGLPSRPWSAAPEGARPNSGVSDSPTILPTAPDPVDKVSRAQCAERRVADTFDLDENTLIGPDVDGQLVTITIEHDRARADPESFPYKRHAGTVA